MRFTPYLICLALIGCTELGDTTAINAAPLAGAAPAGAQQAYFMGFPERFFETTARACNQPGQNAVTPRPDEVRCESLPDPESAAALILTYDGTVEDIPKYIISFQGRDTELGYLVTADTYIRIPQRAGGARNLRFTDAQVASDLSEILEAAGGRPL